MAGSGKKKKKQEIERMKVKVPPDIRQWVEEILMENDHNIEDSITFQVETRLDERVKVFEEMLKQRDDKIEALEAEIKKLNAKKTTFADITTESVANRRAVFEWKTGNTLAPSALPGQSRIPSPSSRTPPPIRNPSLTAPAPETTTSGLNQEEIKRQLSICKRRVNISPVNEQHIITNYQVMTSDLATYSTEEVMSGDKHEQARIACAVDFFRDELTVAPHLYKIEKVEMHGVLEKQTMIVTLQTEAQVRKLFVIGVKAKNQGVKIENNWPTFSYNRRRVLFDWAKDAKIRNPASTFQVRMGNNDLQPHMKNPGEYYYPIALGLFAEMAGHDLDSLPAFSYKQPQKAPGRSNKRVSSSPLASESTRQREDDVNSEETQAGANGGEQVVQNTTGDTEQPEVTVDTESSKSGGMSQVQINHNNEIQ